MHDFKQYPIAVYDSGVGGLTILNTLINALPNEHFVYFADSFHCPYGNRSRDEINQLVINMMTLIQKQSFKAIVIACNTASSHAEAFLNSNHPEIIGTIHATASYAIRHSKTSSIALLATQATIVSGAYEKAIGNERVLYSLACSEFVPFIEHNETDTPECAQVVWEKLAPLAVSHMDLVILGCTHFPIIKDKIHQALPTATLIESDVPVLEQLNTYLAQYHMRNKQKAKGTLVFYTTGDPVEFAEQIQWFVHPYQSIQKITIGDINERD